MAARNADSPASGDASPRNAQEKRNLGLDVLSAKLKQNYDFFAGLSDGELVDFLRLCDSQTYQRGEIIFEEGEREGYWFIILSGRVLIYREETELGYLGEGQCFGEVGLLKDAPRSTSARAELETLLLGVPRNILAEDMPALGYKVLEYFANQLADKLMKANIQIENPNIG